MNDKIKELVKKYNNNYIENEKVKMKNEEKRKSFVEDFPKEKIDKIDISDFVLREIDGVKAKNRGPNNNGTFIYRLEHETRSLTENEIKHDKKAPSWYMAIGNRDEKSKWGCSNILDKSIYPETIKQIVKVLDEKNLNNYDTLLDSKTLDKQVICKLLVTYYPNLFLPNASSDIAKTFLKIIGKTYNENDNILQLNDYIIEWKNSNEETKKWDNIDISRFMYGADYMDLNNKSKIKEDNNMKKKVNSNNTNKDNDESWCNDLKLKLNKNIILYGPPGTGKTYNTIAYSVAICRGNVGNINDVLNEFKNDPQKIIDEYKMFKDKRQIEFITFHQSYGYEDFIEGIKPNVDEDIQEGNFQYSIEPGVFKKFCFNADKKGNFDELYIKLIELIRNDPNGQLQIQTKNGIIFKVAENSKNNLNLYTGKDFNKNGVLTKERIYGFYKGTNETSFWKTYYKGIIDYIQDSIGKIVDSTNEMNYVFIIDEINRGNISKIFGELITLIEESKRKGMKENASIKLPLSGDELSVPSNVYIIGTMNTADRSIALLDTALRRRFKFIEMMPRYDVLEDLKDIEGVSIKDIAEKINERIEVLFDREHTIGHAYYLRLKDNHTISGLADLFKHHIIPLLQEYFYDDYEKIRYILGDNAKEEDYQFIIKKEIEVKTVFNLDEGNSDDDYLGDDDLKPMYRINENAFNKIESYKGI